MSKNFDIITQCGSFEEQEFIQQAIYMAKNKWLAESHDNVVTIWDLDLPVRTTRIFRLSGISSVSILMQKTEKDLLKLRGFGVGALKYVNEALQKHGLSLKKY